MPRTVDHIVETHRAAQALRARGERIWKERINIYFEEGDTFEIRRDKFAAALKCSRWFKQNDEDSELWTLWDEIKDAENEDHFDSVLDYIYDEADLERVGITFHEPVAA